MYISTTTGTFEKHGSHEAVLDMLKEAGFTAYDLAIYPDRVFPVTHEFCIGEKSLEELRSERVDNPDHLIDANSARELRKYADKIGLVCNQTHAPDPSQRVGDDRFNEFMLPHLINSLEISGILGAKVCVVHPCCGYTPEQNAEFYKKLEPYARRAGVKIGVENMWDWDYEKDEAKPTSCSTHENFKAHLDLLPSDVFCACLDIGHSEMRGLNTSAVQMIKTLGNRIEALHIHDVDLHYDLHTLPYLAKVDYEPIWQALREASYKGDVTFEVGYNKKFPTELYPACARLMAEVGKYIKSKIE